MNNQKDSFDDAIMRASLARLTSDARFDAIVVGSGAAGGRASRELCAAGLKVLTLEAGWAATDARSAQNKVLPRFVRGLTHNPTLRSWPPVVLRAGRKALKVFGRMRQPIQSKCFAWELSPGSFVDDVECPYISEKSHPFLWFRSRQLGGRMRVPGHGRQYYRMGASDFGDGAWPVTYDALQPWYDRIEETLSLRGGNDDHPFVPKSRLSAINTPNNWEASALTALQEAVPEVQPILGRFAPPADDLSQAATTGRLTCRTGAVVRRVLRSPQGVVEGVEWYDIESGQSLQTRAPIVFLCASAFESTRILMLSRDESPRHAIGLHSDALGRYAMDHAVLNVSGVRDADEDVVSETGEDGRSLYIPWSVSPASADASVSPPFGVQIHAHPAGSRRLGVDLVSFAPMQARRSNQLSLDPQRRDAFGMPLLRIFCRYGEEELAVGHQQADALRRVAAALDLRDCSIADRLAPPGSGIHECGTARMGSDPESSVVDSDNQCWDTKGLYVTDAAAFPSLAIQNPTLTLMALTARAAAHAVSGRNTLAPTQDADDQAAIAAATRFMTKSG